MIVQDFKSGELAVYPAHGVGMIMGVESRDVSGINKAFYILKILDTEATIMVPIETASNVGLRKIVKKSLVPKIYEILKDRKEVVLDNQTWNRRYRDYTDKIKSGCVMEVAKVMRDLYLLKFDKELSFGERRMLDTAKNLLVKELSIAKNIKEEKVEEELLRIMQK
ncbi:MAG: CarD family transcriptional regulator [Deltaproteobacteria bacterium GWC2_56_8]|nr:MAG: CarD family transcriptional regulator [Deltaproteobacteria bacterium GWB2_55_19]OGP36066.1 MAG: CarD family transcriptional regulator [Deltaproteobacteria bacterium GWC2_56_8]